MRVSLVARPLRHSARDTAALQRRSDQFDQTAEPVPQVVAVGLDDGPAGHTEGGIAAVVATLAVRIEVDGAVVLDGDPGGGVPEVSGGRVGVARDETDLGLGLREARANDRKSALRLRDGIATHAHQGQRETRIPSAGVAGVGLDEFIETIDGCEWRGAPFDSGPWDAHELVRGLDHLVESQDAAKLEPGACG